MSLGGLTRAELCRLTYSFIVKFETLGWRDKYPTHSRRFVDHFHDALF